MRAGPERPPRPHEGGTGKAAARLPARARRVAVYGNALTEGTPVRPERALRLVQPAQTKAPWVRDPKGLMPSDAKDVLPEESPVTVDRNLHLGGVAYPRRSVR